MPYTTGEDFNGTPRAYQWIRQDLATAKLDAAELVAVSIRYGNKTTLRRLGRLLADMGKPLRACWTS